MLNQAESRYIEGQWVFGGIEEESRRSFMVAVEKRNEAALLPLIEKHFAKGTTIVSNCWKAYCTSILKSTDTSIAQ